MRFFRPVPRVLPAQPTEAAVLADLYRLAWSDCERFLDPRLIQEQIPSAAEVGAWFRGGFEVFRARHEGQLLGAVRCCFPSSTCYVDRLVVDPDVRGRGLGHLLLDHAIARARRAGVTRVWAQCTPRLSPALGLFRSFGFREAARLRVAYQSEEVVLLELPI